MQMVRMFFCFKQINAGNIYLNADIIYFEKAIQNYRNASYSKAYLNSKTSAHSDNIALGPVFEGRQTK
eukprot:c28171_g1_i1 orf=94-297(+)